MKLSIIVPVYNMAAGDKVKYCIQSLLDQRMEDYEVIAVDDASTDDSLLVLQKMAEADPKLTVIASKVNHHQGGARNIGIKAARGEFIGFMDGDDWASPDMFPRLLKKAEETGADVVGCDYSLVDHHTMEIGKVVEVNTAMQTGVLDEEKKKLLILQPGSMVVKIYKKENITENELWFPEDIFYEDNCMASLWMLHCRHFERVAEPLYYYYQHDASTVHRINRQNSENRVTAMELLLEKSRQLGLYEAYRQELEYKYIELGFINTLFGCMPGKMKGKYGFVGQLKRTLLSRIPDFDRNRYYLEKTGGEEQKLIGMLMRSRLVFFAYYKGLRYYRGIRAGKGTKSV